MVDWKLLPYVKWNFLFCFLFLKTEFFKGNQLKKDSADQDRILEQRCRVTCGLRHTKCSFIITLYYVNEITVIRSLVI